MTWAIGVDIGGTFTDCVGIDPEGRLHYAKALSTHDTDASEGVLAALDALAREAGQETSELLGQTTRLGHGTTIGTNLLVERRGREDRPDHDRRARRRADDDARRRPHRGDPDRPGVRRPRDEQARAARPAGGDRRGPRARGRRRQR